MCTQTTMHYTLCNIKSVANKHKVVILHQCEFKKQQGRGRICLPAQKKTELMGTIRMICPICQNLRYVVHGNTIEQTDMVGQTTIPSQRTSERRASSRGESINEANITSSSQTTAEGQSTSIGRQTTPVPAIPAERTVSGEQILSGGRAPSETQVPFATGTSSGGQVTLATRTSSGRRFTLGTGTESGPIVSSKGLTTAARGIRAARQASAGGRVSNRVTRATAAQFPRKRKTSPAPAVPVSKSGEMSVGVRSHTGRQG
jgi:hypothetical protein